MSEPASEPPVVADGGVTPDATDAPLRSIIRDRSLLFGIAAATAVGAVLRLWYLLEHKRSDGNLVDEGDALYYGFQAVVNARGQFFEHPFQGEPAADHPPITSLLLTPVAWITDDRIAPLRLAMTVLGVVTVAMIGLLGAVVATRAGWAGPRRRVVAVAAASVAAVDANLWMNDPLLMSEGPGALVATVLLLVAVHQWDRPSVRGAVVLGAVLGVGVLTRAEFGLFALLVAVPLHLTAAVPWRDRLVRLALCALTSIVVVGPWFAWNLSRFEEPVLISTNDGLTIVGANCPEAYEGPAIGFWLLQCGTDGGLPEGDQSERSRAWRQEGLDYAADHLDRLPAVVAARVGRMWGVYEPRQTVFFNTGEGREAFASWIGLWQLWLLAPVAMAGWLVLRRSSATTTPFTATAVQATVTSALFYGIVRFRIAADVAICVLAAVVVGALADRVTRWAAAQPAPEPFVLGHRPALDGLRAVAVLAVVAFHLDWGIASGGFLGVDLFFVLSGFLITALLLEEHRSTGGTSLRRFWARRALRLLPAIVAVVVAVNVYAVIWEDSGLRGRLRMDSLATLLYVANWKLVADDGFLPELLDHTWSLSIEEQFYLAWPVLFVALAAAATRRAPTRSPGVLARLVVAAGVAGSLASLGIRTALSLTSTEDLAYYATVARADGILAGVALAGAVHAWPSIRGRIPAWSGAAAVLAFVALVVLGGRGRWFDVWGVAAVSAIGLGAIVAALGGRDPATRAASHPVAVAIGRRSYGFYLWHWPVFLILRPSRITDLTWWQLDLLRVAVAAALTWASYRFVERPFLDRKARFAAPTSSPERHLADEPSSHSTSNPS